MPVNEKTPKYVIVAEYRFLKALIDYPDYFNDSRVYESLFIHEPAKALFRSVKKLHEKGTRVTNASLFQTGNEEDYGVTQGVVNAVMEIEENVEKIDDILEILNKANQKRETIQTLEKMIDTAVAQRNEIIPQELTALLFELETVLEKSSRQQNKLQSFDSWFEKYEEDFDERLKGKRHPFSDPLLDGALTKGAYPGSVTMLAGATGMGKSAYALNLINGFVNAQTPTMYVSLEMSGIDTMDRFMSMRREIPTSSLYEPGDAAGYIKQCIKEEKAELSKNKSFFFVEDPDIDLAELLAMIKEFKQRTKEDYLILVVDLITQLGDFMSTSSGMSLANSIEKAMNLLNAIAKKENIHIIGVAQFNREADSARVHSIEDLEHLRPTLNHLKNSHALGERPRQVLSVFRRKYYADRYLPESEEIEYMKDIMEVTVLKQSNGNVGQRLTYMFDGEIFKCTPYFEEKTPEEDEEKKELDSAHNHLSY